MTDRELLQRVYASFLYHDYSPGRQHPWIPGGKRTIALKEQIRQNLGVNDLNDEEAILRPLAIEISKEASDEIVLRSIAGQNS